MPSGIHAATAYITMRLERGIFRQELNGANQQINEFARRTAVAGGILTTFGVAGSLAIKKVVDEASDAVESMNRFMQVFRKAGSGGAMAFTNQLADSIGRSRVQLMDSMSTYQGFFVGLGFGADQAEEFSKQLTKVTLDFASFNNLADADSLRRFIGGLSGSPETLDKFGFNLREAAVNQELLAMGINKTTRSATEQQKVLAKMNIIMRTMTEQGATGDALRTADEYANSIKRLNAAFQELAVVMGGALIEDFKGLAAGMADSLREMRLIVKGNEQLVSTITKVVAALTASGVALVAFAAAIRIASLAATAFSTAWQWITTGPLAGALANLGRTIMRFGGAIAAAAVGVKMIAVDGVAAMVELNKQGAKAREIMEDIESLRKDRTNKKKEEFEKEKGGPMAAVKEDQLRAERDRLAQRLGDYKRLIEKMESGDGYEQMGGFFSELFNYIGTQGASSFKNRDNKSQDFDAKLKFTAEELQMYRDLVQDLTNDINEIDKQLNTNRQEEQAAASKKKREDAATRAGEDFGKAFLPGFGNFLKDTLFKDVYKKIKRQNEEAARKAGEDFGKAYGDTVIDWIKELPISKAIAEGSRIRKMELGEVGEALQFLRSTRGKQMQNSFGFKGAGEVQKMGGVFGVSDSLAQQRQAAKEFIKQFEAKYPSGAEMKEKLKRDMEIQNQFEDFMDSIGGI